VATHDYVISNGTGSAVRSDINGALAAIVSQNSNASAPATTYAYMTWADTSAGVMKMRNSANSAWISLYELDGTFLASDISLAAGSAAAPSLFFTGDTNTGLFSPGADTVALATAGQNRLHVSSGGLVGIGTTSPATALQVVGTARFGNGTAGTVSLTSDSNLSYYDSLNNAATGFQPGVFRGTELQFHTNSSGTPTVKATIDSSGRLLVGTSSALPVYYDGASTWQGQFQVARSDQNAVANFSIWNSTASTYTNYGGVQLHLSACRSGTVGTHTSGALSSGDTIGSITFDASDGTNFRNSARIEAVVDGGVSTGDVPGRLVFSTTADGAASPTERMRIGNNGRSDFFADATVATVLASAKAASTSDYLYVGRYGSTGAIDAGTTSFLVYTNGNVQNTNNSYGAISDLKLKENIVDANSQWDDLKALQVRKYNFKEGQTHTQIGLIAQEVELVSPGLVSESPDRDEEGNDLGTVTKSVNYSVLYMKAVKALQEAMERIEALEADVAALKGA